MLQQVLRTSDSNTKTFYSDPLSGLDKIEAKPPNSIHPIIASYGSYKTDTGFNRAANLHTLIPTIITRLYNECLLLAPGVGTRSKESVLLQSQNAYFGPNHKVSYCSEFSGSQCQETI